MKKDKIITLVLIIMTIFLISAIFYFSYLLMETPSGPSDSSAVAPKKTKAQVVNSEKFVVLNRTDSLSPTPTVSFTPTPTFPLSPTPLLTDTPTVTQTEEPTPTEIILAKSISATPSSTESSYLSPTETERLPDTGYFNHYLLIFGVAIFLILYSLII